MRGKAFSIAVLTGSLLMSMVPAQAAGVEGLAIETAMEKKLLSKDYYRWVFRTVIEDRANLREILEKNDIILP